MEMIVQVGGEGAKLGASGHFRFQTTAAAIDAVPENAVLDGDIIAEGTWTNTGGDYRVAGNVLVTRVYDCDRCLVHRIESLAYPFDEMFRASEEEILPDGLTPFDGETIPLEPLVRDTILTAQPIQNLCRPDCRGLCPRCGADLNEGECGCDRRPVDPRLAALQYLMKSDH